MSENAPSTPLSRELTIARRLAREAGACIMDHYARDFAVKYKDKEESDPVTAADQDANRIIVEALTAEFPDDGILAEESADSSERLSRPRLWCVDPLDGTREFVDKNGMFVVMIGLAIEGEARLGVVYQPTEDLEWCGIVGRGAMEVRPGGEEIPIHPSETRESASATMVVSRSHRSKTVSAVAETLGVTQQLPLGSVGLKVGRVATGVADLYISVSNRTKEWDACAPEAILRAAGGNMTDIAGRPLRYNKEDVATPYGMLATNGPLTAAAVRALGPVVSEREWG